MKLPHLAILAVLALPAAAALPIACGTDCTINASVFPGYDPLVAYITSGSSVTWHSTDIGHITRDAGLSGADGCFFVTHPIDEDSPPVRFDLVGEHLYATTNGETLLCENATGNGDAAVVLEYFCVLHGFMRASLVVTH